MNLALGPEIKNQVLLLIISLPCYSLGRLRENQFVSPQIDNHYVEFV